MIVAFGKQEKPGESDSIPQEGTLGIELEISQDYWLCLDTWAPVLHKDRK